METRSGDRRSDTEAVARARHEHAAAAHDQAAALHGKAANLQQLHAYEMEELGRPDRAQRAQRLADRERELEQSERLRAEKERARAAAVGQSVDDAGELAEQPAAN